ncbi:NYN domain-containing protein [Brevibacterium iodinum]|uniref:NYN domain-containing protein n=1 Tax=Brevibacterium iodinum TaxID=31943 RepID=UPI001C60D225|nr:NYN domain-containing protein [Brevibacterium iodinum]
MDNSNVWIEGMRISAVRKGLAKSTTDAMNRKITDHDWSYDFGKLYELICPPDQMIGRSSLFGSRPPANDSIWNLARAHGFEVFLFDRNAANKEKQVDVAISTQIMEDSFQHMKDGDRLLLVSGDRDYLPTIESLRNRGFPARVAFWEHATGNELKQAPIDYIPLDPAFDYITRTSEVDE